MVVYYYSRYSDYFVLFPYSSLSTTIRSMSPVLSHRLPHCNSFLDLLRSRILYTYRPPSCKVRLSYLIRYRDSTLGRTIQVTYSSSNYIGLTSLTHSVTLFYSGLYISLRFCISENILFYP